MAQASTEINKFRSQVTALADQLARTQHALQIIADLGGQTFVAPYLVGPEGEPTTDITLEQFLTGYGALAGLLMGLSDAERSAIGVLRI